MLLLNTLTFRIFMLIYIFIISVSHNTSKRLTHDQSEVRNKHCQILIQGELKSDVILTHIYKH